MALEGLAHLPSKPSADLEFQRAAPRVARAPNPQGV